MFRKPCKGLIVMSFHSTARFNIDCRVPHSFLALSLDETIIRSCLKASPMSGVMWSMAMP
jgi:hypothetical protein